eukprot:955953_1
MTTIYFNRLLRKHVSHTSIQSNYRLNFVASLFIIAHCIAIPRLSFDDATHMIPFYAFSILGILCTFYQAVPSFIACVGCIRWYSRVAIDYNHYKSTLYALCLFIPLSSAQMTEWFSISDPILPRTVSWSASGYSSTNKMIWMLDCQYFSQIGSILYVIEPNTNPSLLNTFDVDTGVYTRSFASTNTPVADNGCLASIEDTTGDYLSVIKQCFVQILRLSDMSWLSGLSGAFHGAPEHGCIKRSYFPQSYI